MYHYDSFEEFDGNNELSGLFTRYVNAFLKLKQQASGWPGWCTTDEMKQQYIDEYVDCEGVTLDPTQIDRNEGLRSLGKLCLNSHWVFSLFPSFFRVYQNYV